MYARPFIADGRLIAMRRRLSVITHENRAAVLYRDVKEACGVAKMVTASKIEMARV